MEWKITNDLIDYKSAIDFMEARVKSISENNAKELVWLLEHNHLYTAGTSAKDDELIKNSNIPIYLSGRGGRYTYHGPGQRIAYLMLDLKKRGCDIKKYIYDLEEWLILSLKSINILAQRREGRIGLWVDTAVGEKKIAAIGIRVRKWIAYHGVAINVDPDLNYYNDIIPCGIKEYGVTSIKDLNMDITMNEIDKILINHFEAVFS